MLFVARDDAWALNRDRLITEFLHTGWTVADGAPSGVHALAQTTDGYLWLASTTGLFRFDGVRFERYQPPQGGSLQFRDISALLATPDGGLWIGRAGGAIYLKDGRAETYGRIEGLPLATIFRFAIDKDGAVWAATSRGLARFDGRSWTQLGPEWNFTAESAADVFVESDGTVWVTAPGALFVLRHHSRAFETRAITNPVVLREAPDRTLWMAEFDSGLHAVGGTMAQLSMASRPTVPLRGALREFLVDRDGSLWFADEGLARIGDPRRMAGLRLDPSSNAIQRFTQSHGLTGNTIVTALEDREGNIWVATTAGLDRFRHRNVVPGPFPMGNEPMALITDQHGEVLAAGETSLLQLKDSIVTARALFRMPARYRSARFSIRSAYRDSADVIWLGGQGTLLRVVGNRTEAIPLPSEISPASQRNVQAVTRDRSGDVWVAIQQHGIFRLHNGAWQAFGDELGRVDRTPISLFTDANGRVWFSYVGTKVVMRDGQRSQTYTSDGLRIGNVTFVGGREKSVWLVGQSGFALLEGDHFKTVISDADGDFRGISGIVQTDNGDFWLNQATGLAHVPAAEIANRLKNSSHPLRYRLFDFRDGVPASATINEPVPSAVLAGDGRIWVSGSNGTFWLDPSDLYVNALPPPVSIEAIYLGETRNDPSTTVALPALASNVRIEYSALSLSIPERVRFRYRLEGVDPDWQDAGSRRTAFYTRLPPGRFRFHVIAANNDGVWNDRGATATIVVAPAFFQTTWFAAACLVAGVGLLWALYWLRVRQLSAQMHARLEERLDERTRIARELHDTLLQTVQGSKLVADQALDDFRDHDRIRPVIEQLSTWLARASEEARAALNSLRSAAFDANDLTDKFQNAISECRTGGDVAVSLVVTGTTRMMHAIVSDEIYRIGYEALRNACSHSKANQITVRVDYGSDFHCSIQDNGIGFNPETSAKGKEGHFGIPGMRERARSIGAELAIATNSNAGTTVTLLVPGRIAFPEA